MTWFHSRADQDSRLDIFFFFWEHAYVADPVKSWIWILVETPRRSAAVIDVELSPDDSAIRPHIQNGGPCVLIPLFDSARYPEVICIHRPAEWIMQTSRDPIRTVFMHRFPLFLLPYFRFLPLYDALPAPADLELTNI